MRRQIVVNSVANSIVNRGGITFAFRTAEETGAGAEQVARAFVVAREIFGLRDFVAEVEALDNVVSTQVQSTLYLEFRRLIDRTTRWLIHTRPEHIDIAAEIDRFRDVVATMSPRSPICCAPVSMTAGRPMSMRMSHTEFRSNSRCERPASWTASRCWT